MGSGSPARTIHRSAPGSTRCAYSATTARFRQTRAFPHTEAAVLSKAGAEAAEKVAAARKEIDGQKQAALKALRNEVAGYAKNVAEKVLSKA